MPPKLFDAAVCVVATNYKAVCAESSKARDEICLLVCCCDKFPVTTATRRLKQVCVDMLLRGKKSNLRGILPAVPFDMSKTPPRALQNKNDSLLTAMPRWKKLVSDDETKSWLADNKNNSGTKLVRIPDVVVLKNPGGEINQDNIDKIYEIKFPGDRWGTGQRAGYEEIAGDEKKVKELNPQECRCADQELEHAPVSGEVQKMADDLAKAAETKLREMLWDVARNPSLEPELLDVAGLALEILEAKYPHAAALSLGIALVPQLKLLKMPFYLWQLYKFTPMPVRGGV